MNFWGFQPGYFDWLERGLTHFLDEQGNELKSEYFIPTVVNQLINDGREKVKVLSSDAKWFGVTYKQDKKQVQEQILALIKTGAYPEKLWG